MDLSRVALYVQVPWVGSSSFQQIFVLYQASQHPSAPVSYTHLTLPTMPDV